MSIDPKILKLMNHDEASLLRAGESRRVKMERGQNWLVRFLPARFGENGLWYARIARHWLGKVPTVCPRNTSPDYGGDPEVECPVCILAEELNSSSNEDISKCGYNARANIQFLTYCMVIEKNGALVQSLSEMLNPYEFWHYKSTWEELKGFYIAGASSRVKEGQASDSVLDYYRGNDFSANRTGKGIRLDKQDAGPIFTDIDIKDPRFAERIRKLEAAMKQPKVVIPTHQQLQTLAQKLQEMADRGGASDSGASSRTRRRPIDEDEGGYRRPRRPAEESEDEIPYKYPTRAAGPLAEDDEEVPPARPAPRARPVVDEEISSPAPRRGLPEPDVDEAPRKPARQSAPEAEEITAPARRRAPEPLPEEDEIAAGQTVSRRPAPAPLRRSAPAPVADPEPETPTDDPEPVDDDISNRQVAAPSNKPALRQTARRAAAAAAPEEPADETAPVPAEEEDGDPFPEETKDVVPPVDNHAPEPPTPVERRGSQSAVIRARIAEAKSKKPAA